MKNINMFLDHCLGFRIALVNDSFYLTVDHRRYALAIIFRMTDIASDEHFFVFILIVDHADFLRHTIFDHHGSGNGSCLFDILGRTRGNIVKDQLLRDPSA